MAVNKNNTVEMRDAYGKALLELAEEYDNMVYVDADLHTSTKAVWFKERYLTDLYKQVLQNKISLVCLQGWRLRALFLFLPHLPFLLHVERLDQIAISICFAKANVKIPGSYVGIPTSRAGGSHNAIEDIAVMRAMPNLLVADPGSNEDLRQIMKAAMKIDGPVYFRITRYTVPELFDGVEHTFEWGKGHTLVEGSDVTLFGTGVMTSKCLEAAELLAKDGINAEVVHLASIKPIDSDLIVSSTQKTGCAVTAENASIYGGFGDAVLEVLADQNPVPTKKIGVRDFFIESGGIEELFDYYKMQPEHIAEAAKAAIASKKIKDGRYRKCRCNKTLW